ncbi:uncharacterized protein LOC133792392 [Humulus lupulus]|uniref:uncharacterized protein LOC133792392 n=1 Tax=Humulus lupulus TaxID=3486 RepID=UPI002B40BF26|nr:uncharacterized protein LOC133792392 [Humulus lupulus]
MTISLGAKNKREFVDGSLPKPPSTVPIHSSWLRCNNMAMSWILISISNEITDLVMYLKTAVAIWQEITDRFSEGNDPRNFEIKQVLSQLWQGDDAASAYFCKLKDLWDEINEYHSYTIYNCEGGKNNLDLYNRDQVLLFLARLNESFHSIRGPIILIEPFPSLAKVFSMVIHDERKHKIGTSITNNLVATIVTPKTQNPSLNSPHNPNPPSTLSTTATSRTKKPRYTCSHCHIP